MPYANLDDRYAYLTKRYAKRRATGLCKDCPKPAREGKVYCAECAAKTNALQNKRKAKLRAAGICPQCNNPARKGKTLCVACATKHKTRQAELRHMRRAAAVADMYTKQGGKCSGCQRPFPQRCLAIDHIQPRSKGGGNTPSNLQLLCHYCNSTKLNRTQSDLITVLRKRGIIDAAGNNIEVGYGAG